MKWGECLFSLNFECDAHFSISDIKQIPNRAGIYIFRDKKGVPLYVGISGSLKSRIQGHLNGTPILRDSVITFILSQLFMKTINL